MHQCIADVAGDDHNPEPLAREAFGEREAETATGAGDNDIVPFLSERDSSRSRFPRKGPGALRMRR